MKLALSLAVLATVAFAPVAVQAKSLSEHQADWLAKRAEWVAKWEAHSLVKPMTSTGESSIVSADGGFKIVLCDEAEDGKKYLLECSWE